VAYYVINPLLKGSDMAHVS